MAKPPEAAFRFETPARPTSPPAEWLTFHLAHPGPGIAWPGADPNCAFFWAGRYHLHYMYKNDDGYAFAHVSSPDMLHWSWHPTTLTPSTTGHGMWSGTGFLTRDGRPAMIYHGFRDDDPGKNELAFAEDDRLERWSTPVPVEPRVRPDQDGDPISEWDPDAWLEGDTYYAIFGGHPRSGKPATVHRSADLANWDYLGLFLSRDLPEAADDIDISCPNFFPIGGKHMLLCISHNLGCRYYLGEWKDEQFTPDFHARMNWRGQNFFAPESLLTPDGRRVMWAWCQFDEAPQSGIQSLPRELSLPDDGVLRIRPLRELASLRSDETHARGISVTPGERRPVPGIAGDALEIAVSIRPGSAERVGVVVHADADGHGGVAVTVDRAARSLSIGDVVAPFDLAADDTVELTVFVDKNMVEVFANERQAMVAWHPAEVGDTHLSLFTDGADVTADVTAWALASIYAP